MIEKKQLTSFVHLESWTANVTFLDFLFKFKFITPQLTNNFNNNFSTLSLTLFRNCIYNVRKKKEEEIKNNDKYRMIESKVKNKSPNPHTTNVNQITFNLINNYLYMN